MMNLKEKIEEWEKTKHEISPWPWAEISSGDIVDSKEKQVILSFHHQYNYITGIKAKQFLEKWRIK